MGWLYGIQSGLFIKVGVANNIKTRLHQMNLLNPHPCKVVVRRQVANVWRVERRMHEMLAPYAIGREWFMCDPPVVRTALTAVLKEVAQWRLDQILWEARCAQREDEKKAKRASGVRNV